MVESGPDEAAASTEPVADLGDAAVRARLTPAAVTALVNIARRWGLTDLELEDLLGVPAGTCVTWGSDPPADLGEAVLTRASQIVAIDVCLHALYPAELANQWVQRPNTNALFGGRKPLAALLAGGDGLLGEVRGLLEARRS